MHGWGATADPMGRMAPPTASPPPRGGRSEVVASAAVPAADLDDALRGLGYEAFRPGQRQAVETLLSAGRLLLVAPTGGGKSLVYQLAARVLPGTTVVVSPLVALMQDQVEALAARGVAATYLASTLEEGEIRRRMAALAAGRYELVYLAPERLRGESILEILVRIDVPLLAVDEAHCISEWGHDFRPDYLALGALRRLLPEARVLACTATATPVVRDEILARLELPADTPQLVRGFSRPNLVLAAQEVARARERHRAVDALLVQALGTPGAARGAAIVYGPTRASTEKEAARLAGAGWRVDHYHAGRSGEERTAVQEAFMRGDLEVVVATNAFGMGIDRPDVRAVVHLAPPGSIEAYYQEVGRAGRDGKTAYGLLLSSAQDVALRRRLLERPVDGRAPDPAVVEHKWSLFLELLRWAEGGACRHDAILRYFGDDAELLGGCGRCDVCTSLDDGAQDPEHVALVVRKALSGVARVHGRFGLRAAVELLAGKSDARLERAGLTAVRTFGVLREHDEGWILRVLRRCVTAGYVGFSQDERPVVYLTERGRAVMTGALPVRVLLPPETAEPRPKAAPGGGRRPRSRSGGVVRGPSGPAARTRAPGRRAPLRGGERPDPAGHRPPAPAQPGGVAGRARDGPGQGRSLRRRPARGGRGRPVTRVRRSALPRRLSITKQESAFARGFVGWDTTLGHGGDGRCWIPGSPVGARLDTTCDCRVWRKSKGRGSLRSGARHRRDRTERRGTVPGGRHHDRIERVHSFAPRGAPLDERLRR